MTTRATDKATALNAIFAAIRERRAWIKTFAGNRVVVAYDDDTGWATTDNEMNNWDRKSFMVCRSDIRVAAEPLFTDRRVTKHTTFVFDGKPCEATEHTVERVWSWPPESAFGFDRGFDYGR